jgi:hypothetical protein
MANYNIPSERIIIGVIDLDEKGCSGGTLFWVTQTIHVRITDSKESYLKKAREAFDAVVGNLIEVKKD